MTLKDLFAAIDARPFRPFWLEIVSGKRVRVKHPENIFVLPNRFRVDNIQVYHPKTGDWDLIYPEGLAGLSRDAKSRRGRRR